jgi:hypothetical protein
MWQAEIGLATATPLPHNATMGDVHPFTFKIEADPLSKRQFRWTICKGGQIHIRSPRAYPSRRETEIEAKEAMLRWAATWRRDK